MSTLWYVNGINRRTCGEHFAEYPGFSSSAFGVCITELVDGMVNALHAEEYPRTDLNEIIQTTLDLLDKYGITFENRCRVFADGTNPSFIPALKDRIIGEDSDYERLIAHINTQYGTRFNLQYMMYSMFAVPVAFNKEHGTRLLTQRS